MGSGHYKIINHKRQQNKNKKRNNYEFSYNYNRTVKNRYIVAVSYMSYGEWLPIVQFSLFVTKQWKRFKEKPLQTACQGGGGETEICYLATLTY